MFTSERSCAGRQMPTSFWQGLNRNKLLKKWQGMPESVAVYHRNGWQGLLWNIYIDPDSFWRFLLRNLCCSMLCFTYAEWSKRYCLWYSWAGRRSRQRLLRPFCINFPFEVGLIFLSNRRLRAFWQAKQEQYFCFLSRGLRGRVLPHPRQVKVLDIRLMFFLYPKDCWKSDIYDHIFDISTQKCPVFQLTTVYCCYQNLIGIMPFRHKVYNNLWWN